MNNTINNNNNNNNNNDFITPMPNDVLLGRGRSNKDHPGNMYYQALIRKYHKQYFSMQSQREKYQLSSRIVKIIKANNNNNNNNGGRFLKMEHNNNKDGNSISWKIINDNAARIKVAHTLQYYERINKRNNNKKDDNNNNHTTAEERNNSNKPVAKSFQTKESINRTVQSPSHYTTPCLLQQQQQQQIDRNTNTTRILLLNQQQQTQDNSSRFSVSRNNDVSQSEILQKMEYEYNNIGKPLLNHNTTPFIGTTYNPSNVSRPANFSNNNNICTTTESDNNKQKQVRRRRKGKISTVIAPTNKGGMPLSVMKNHSIKQQNVQTTQTTTTTMELTTTTTKQTKPIEIYNIMYSKEISPITLRILGSGSVSQVKKTDTTTSKVIQPVVNNTGFKTTSITSEIRKEDPSNCNEGSFNEQSQQCRYYDNLQSKTHIDSLRTDNNNLYEAEDVPSLSDDTTPACCSNNNDKAHGKIFQSTKETSYEQNGIINQQSSTRSKSIKMRNACEVDMSSETNYVDSNCISTTKEETTSEEENDALVYDYEYENPLQQKQDPSSEVKAINEFLAVMQLIKLSNNNNNLLSEYNEVFLDNDQVNNKRENCSYSSAELLNLIARNNRQKSSAKTGNEEEKESFNNVESSSSDSCSTLLDLQAAIPNCNYSIDMLRKYYRKSRDMELQTEATKPENQASSNENLMTKG